MSLLPAAAMMILHAMIAEHGGKHKMLIVVIIVAAVVIFAVVKEKGLWAARARNSIVSMASGQNGLCSECRHCRKDTSHRFSNTDYFCSISKCNHITESTRMNCFEKPQITENDLNQLFSMGVWNGAGRQYLRQTLLGKAMTWTELDNYLKRLPHEHPEYMDQARKSEYISRHS